MVTLCALPIIIGVAEREAMRLEARSPFATFPFPLLLLVQCQIVNRAVQDFSWFHKLLADITS